MNTNSAPMLCAVSSGTIAGSGSWFRQDHQEDRGVRRNDSRHDRRLRKGARRAMRRSEKAELAVELADDLGYETEAFTGPGLHQWVRWSFARLLDTFEQDLDDAVSAGRRADDYDHGRTSWANVGSWAPEEWSASEAVTAFSDAEWDTDEQLDVDDEPSPYGTVLELGLVDGTGSEWVDGFIITRGDWYRRGENGIAA